MDASTKVTLTQVQIIKSLGEMLAIFEQEVAWGVDPAENRHLTGRIGELYAAMITRGQMALSVNQRGYDVVSALNERISVKTVTSSTSVTFNRNTFDQVDRVIVLRINVDDEAGISVEEILDAPADEAKALMRDYTFAINRGPRQERPVEELSITASASKGTTEIVRYENGAIRVMQDGVVIPVVVKEVLREIAPDVGVDLFNGSGGLKNTRQLGADVITAMNARKYLPL